MLDLATENEGGISMHTPTAHEIETFSGQFVDLSDPDYRTIVLEDVAHGLAHTCRYNGQVKFYSVAEHAVAVSERLERLGFDRDMCLAGLHHDDAEAYLGDVTRPLKSLLQPNYGILTNMMDRAINHGLDLHFGVYDLLHYDVVKDADNWALMREARHLLPSKGANWAGNGCNWDVDVEADADDDPWVPECLDPSAAEGAWLSRHFALIA